MRLSVWDVHEPDVTDGLECECLAVGRGGVPARETHGESVVGNAALGFGHLRNGALHVNGEGNRFYLSVGNLDAMNFPTL